MTTFPPNPREFFDGIVKPSHDAWISNPLEEWMAKAATSNADIMAERVFSYWQHRDQTKVGAASTVRQYRTYLKESVCADFGLVWDIHDGHKHMRLDRTPRQVTSANQTGVSSIGWGEGGYGEGVWGGGQQIVGELDDSSKRALSAVVENVMEMWIKLLADMGL